MNEMDGRWHRVWEAQLPGESELALAGRLDASVMAYKAANPELLFWREDVSSRMVAVPEQPELERRRIWSGIVQG